MIFSTLVLFLEVICRSRIKKRPIGVVFYLMFSCGLRPILII